MEQEKRIIDRVEELLFKEKMQEIDFTRKCGLAQGVMTYLRNRPSSDMSLTNCKRIIENFPNVSPEWLVFGYGEMYRTNSANGSSSQSNIKFGDVNYGNVEFKSTPKTAQDGTDWSATINTLLAQQNNLINQNSELITIIKNMQNVTRD